MGSRVRVVSVPQLIENSSQTTESGVNGPRLLSV